MKKCTKCNKEKRINEFSTRLGKPTNRCKPCKYKYNNSWRKKKRDETKKYYWVYYLPEEHYIGITSDIEARMKAHRYKGKITDGYELCGKYRHPAQAIIVEALFHLREYNGCNYKYYE